MQITVYNNNNQVFNGSLSEFLNDNENDESLTAECNRLEKASQIEFNEISGHWRIERI